MKVIYGKPLTIGETQIVKNISLECGIMFDTARLLFYRNIDSVEKAKRFLNPGKHAFHDPYLLSDMENAVKRIRLAKELNQKVLIFGDYDADGVCATTILYFCLKQFGINARTVIPEREEGYGINIETVKKHYNQEKIDLLITVDCGISDYEKIEELKLMGIDVIVTDHHEPPEILPDCIKINPKIEGQQYPFNGLCGAGVAYKLGYALIGDYADEYLDFTALATVADSMDLIDENRDIVVEGLKIFNSEKIKPAFKCILGENNRQISAQQTLAYTIAPRINAGGRLGDANSALQLFKTQKPTEIFDLTAKLNGYNIARQVECENIYREAKQIIGLEQTERDSIILVKNEKWSAGFIGIVAAKLVEDYCRPVIVFAGHDDYLKGSARSVDGLNIYDAISSVKDLLLGYGGHSQAAGVSVSKENFDKLKKALNKCVKEKIQNIDTTPKILAEWNLDKAVSMRFAKEIDMLEPFGVGNKKPVFTTDVEQVNVQPLKNGSPHYTFSTDVVDMLNFNGESDVIALSLPIKKKIAFELNLSVFKNHESLKGYVRAVCPDYEDFSNIDLYVFENNLKGLLDDVKGKAKQIKASEVEIFDSATVYAVSDTKTLKNYNTLSKIPRKLFATDNKNSENCIVVSLSKISDNYKRIVYLDKPMQEIYFSGDSYVVSENVGYKILDKVSVDRGDFALVFNLLKSNCGRRFESASSFYYRFINDDNAYNFVFATTVFLELKIFEIKNGLLTFNNLIKNPLTNSKVYSKICLLKG